MNTDLINALVDLKEEEALDIVHKRLENADNPLSILNESRQSMEVVGERFASGEYFIPDLIYSGEILKEITEIVKPKLHGAYSINRQGKIVLGTVAGDIHDIGLNIVEFMLDVNGFEVINLGVDVPANKFVDKIAETGAPVLGLSGFLTLAFDSMKATIEAVDKAGLRGKIKIMIGGGQIDEQVRSYTKADAYGTDAVEAVTLAKQWFGAKND